MDTHIKAGHMLQKRFEDNEYEVSIGISRLEPRVLVRIDEQGADHPEIPDPITEVEPMTDRADYEYEIPNEENLHTFVEETDEFSHLAEE